MKKDQVIERNGLKTIEPDGKPAVSRFSDPVALRNTYDILTQNDSVESTRRAKLLKLYDGFLPYDPNELAKCGLKNLTNVNWLGLKGAIDNRADVILKLTCDTADLIELHPKSREFAGPDAVRASKVLAEEISTMIREEGSTIPTLAMMNTQADLYGLGPVTFMNSVDYRPTALERGQIRFLSDSPVQSSRQELVMFQATLPASYLFFCLDHEDIAVEEGWDIAGIKDLLIKKFRDHFDTSADPHVDGGTSYIEHRISMIRQNRFEEEHQFDHIDVIHAFVKELGLPRGVTHIIIPGAQIEKDSTKFLFRKLNAYRTMDECFLWFPYSVNQRNAREIHGLASFLYPIELLNNKYKCRVMDLAFQYASLIYSQTTAGNQQQISLLENGPITVVPKDLQAVQNNNKPDMGQVIAVSQYADNLGVNSVTGGDRPQISQTGPKLDKGPDRQTKAEVEIQQRLRSRKEEALFVQRMSVLDKIFREMYRRVMRIVEKYIGGDTTILADYPEISDMLDRCELRGFDAKTLVAMAGDFQVVTCRDLVLGSEGKVGVLTELLGNFGANLDEPGRKNAQRDWVQLRLGTASADRYAPEISRDHAPSDQASAALVENGLMKMGQPVAAGTDQMHWSHIPVHSQLLQEIVNAVAAPEDNAPDAASFNNAPETDMPIGEQTLQRIGDDPKKTLSILVSCSKHVQEHLAIGGQQKGMEGAAKQVAAMLRDLRPTIKALNLAVATQERVEQAQREQAERDRQAEIDRLANEKAGIAQIEADAKLRADTYRIDREHEARMHEIDLKHGLSLRDEARKDEITAGDEARKDAIAAGQINREDKITQAKTNAASAIKRMNAVQDATGFGSVSPSDVSGQELEEPANPLSL